MNEEETDALFPDETPEETPEKKGKKPVFLKQYLVSGSKNIFDASVPRLGAFILATCARNAREEFENRFGMKILSCQQIAETDWLPSKFGDEDPWKTNRNWTMDICPPEMSESAKRYFRLKERGVIVQAAKKKAGIVKWGEETEDQRRIFDAELKRLEANR